MAILLTGGTGKTSVPIARLCQQASIQFLLASRRGPAAAPPGMPAVKFDWLNDTTFETPFQHEFPAKEKISAVYLVAPEILDPVPVMNAFIDLAFNKYGVKRFVLLAGSSVEIGGWFVGKVWQHLVEIGVDYCVLRPTWFNENFLEPQFQTSIKNEGKIYTACGDGKIRFISASDIGASAFRALTDEEPHNTDHRILGPEFLTYDDVAAKFGKVLGRNVVHVKLSEEEKIQRLQGLGMPELYAKFMASFEVKASHGFENLEGDAVERVTGKTPQTLDAWIEENKAAWQ